MSISVNIWSGFVEGGDTYIDVEENITDEEKEVIGQHLCQLLRSYGPNFDYVDFPLAPECHHQCPIIPGATREYVTEIIELLNEETYRGHDFFAYST